jgi:hypothetical protein
MGFKLLLASPRRPEASRILVGGVLVHIKLLAIPVLKTATPMPG